jgi:hypothetical protein
MLGAGKGGKGSISKWTNISKKYLSTIAFGKRSELTLNRKVDEHAAYRVESIIVARSGYLPKS